MCCLPKGSLSSICGAGPLSDTVTSRRLGSKGTSHLFSWALSWLEDSRWTFMAWTVSSTHFKTWQEETNTITKPEQSYVRHILGPIKRRLSGIPSRLRQTGRGQEGHDCCPIPESPSAKPFPAQAAGCSLSSGYSFIAKVFLREILPKQRKSSARLSN